LLDILSLAPCCITVAHAFGRIGCFFAGCCYGKPTDSFLGVQFPKLPVPVHPTQLYEAAFLFFLFGSFSYLLLRRNFRHNLSLYLISYGVFRFAMEFLRNDHRGALVSGLSPSQFWSILMVVLGAALVPLLDRAYQKLEASQAATDPTPAEPTETER
jgi:phosphatidylglycerol:prolipoprotein diacylglycerol transferase